MKTSHHILSLSMALSVLGAVPARPARPSIPYVATRNDAVRDMLWLADVGKDDVVYDLGAGDGRIVIAAARDRAARRAVGIEIDPERIRESLANAAKAGVTNRVEFIAGDLFTSDFRQASVVALFLGHEPNLGLRPKLLRWLQPGARVVSHQFGMGEWPADKTLAVRVAYLGMQRAMWNPFRGNPHVPDYTGNEMRFGRSDTILMWVVPARVAGIWEGKIETPQGPRDLQLILHQRLSKVTGSFQVSGQPEQAGHVSVDLWGDHVRFWCIPDLRGAGPFEVRFDGHVQGNTMQGKLAVSDRGQLREGAWEAQRAPADYTGTWQWPCFSGSRSVRLRIERRDGEFIATYLDEDRTMPVTDFYDFGGGFYFTLLFGREGHSLRIAKDTGWLIGEGLLEHGALKATIEFHPSTERPGGPAGANASPATIQQYAPRVISKIMLHGFKVGVRADYFWPVAATVGVDPARLEAVQARTRELEEIVAARLVGLEKEDIAGNAERRASLENDIRHRINRRLEGEPVRYVHLTLDIK